MNIGLRSWVRIPSSPSFIGKNGSSTKMTGDCRNPGFDSNYHEAFFNENLRIYALIYCRVTRALALKRSLRNITFSNWVVSVQYMQIFQSIISTLLIRRFPKPGMHMGQSTGPVYGGPVQRRPAPYPNPMYMANKRQQQPGMFHPAMNQVRHWRTSGPP